MKARTAQSKSESTKILTHEERDAKANTLAYYKNLGESLFIAKMAFMEAGFTEDEAFTLVKGLLKKMI